MNIRLTSREIEVCALLMLGLTYREAGTRLSISRRTVEDHSLNVQRKFNVHKLHHLIFKLWELPEYIVDND